MDADICNFTVQLIEFTCPTFLFIEFKRTGLRYLCKLYFASTGGFTVYWFSIIWILRLAISEEQYLII